MRPGAKFCNRCSHPLSPSPTNWVYVPLQAGQVMKAGGITIEHRLGEGGMGAIYLAQQILAGRKRPVVVKEMLDYFDPTDVHAAQSAQKRFQEEAATLVTLNHPGIPQIHDYFTELGRNYIVMQFIEGENLLARLTHTDKYSKLINGKPYATKEVVHWGMRRPNRFKASPSYDRMCLH
jgi:serine/threonine protein kinase